MFAASYFAPRYFTGSYWTKLGLQVEVPIEPPLVTGGPPHPPRRVPFERIDAIARGRVLVLRWSLVPGLAFGTGKAFGDAVLVANAVAPGAALDVQQWQIIGGAARSKIILTDDEEIMLILADAA